MVEVRAAIGMSQRLPDHHQGFSETPFEKMHS
jgi:hypothetical protein